jgi:beta-glucanase (GH16 family)
MPRNGLPRLQSGYKWQEVFSDEFNGNSLNANKWVTCYDWYNSHYNGCTNSGNYELEWYTPQQVSVHNGYALLRAIASPIKGWNGSHEQSYPYQSGMISTGSGQGQAVKSSYSYGYFVARLKTISGKGLWPAFWLLPADHTWPPEIDIMEIVGDRPNNVLMTYYWGNVDSPQKDSSVYTSLKQPNAWHTYAVNWQPGRIDWYIDGVLRKSVVSKHVPSKPMEVIANLAVGGKLPGNPNNASVFPASLQIDYIRIYKLTKN